MCVFFLCRYGDSAVHKYRYKIILWKPNKRKEKQKGMAKNLNSTKTNNATKQFSSQAEQEARIYEDSKTTKRKKNEYQLTVVTTANMS